MTLHAVGVRHHSPACARLVARTIERVRPRFVLVEGPSDMNGRLGELALGHELPVAVFTYCTEGGKSFASWTPFCESSPEWDALWDHLFEQGDDGSRAFPTFFDEMRKDEPPGKRDEEREAYMARCVAWALAQGGDTVLVCGGYHAPFLETAAPSMTSEWPEVPRPPEGSRSGSYLVPYSFHRL